MKPHSLILAAAFPILSILPVISIGHADDLAPEPVSPLPVGQLAITGQHSGMWRLYHCGGASPAVAVGEAFRACYLPVGRLAFEKEGVLQVRDLKIGSDTPLNLAAGTEDFDILPKGGEIVYVSGDRSIIQVTKMDGSSSRPLIKGGPGDRFSQPKWSPDGKRILFLKGKPKDVVAQVFVAGADGGNLAAVSPAGGMHDSPCWSPDGKQIAFVNLRESTIHIQHLDGGKPRVIDKSKEVQPMNGIAWSPDGQWIAYGRGALNKGHGVWIVRPDGSDERQIFTSREREVHWMPLSWAR